MGQALVVHGVRRLGKRRGTRRHHRHRTGAGSGDSGATSGSRIHQDQLHERQHEPFTAAGSSLPAPSALQLPVAPVPTVVVGVAQGVAVSEGVAAASVGKRVCEGDSREVYKL